MVKIEKQIEKLRLELNVSNNKELAESLGVNYQTLSSWIRRGNIPKKRLFHLPKKALNGIQSELGIDIEDISIQAYRPEVRNFNDNISAHLHFISSPILLSKVQETLYAAIICNYLDFILNDIHLPIFEDEYSSENYEKARHEHLGWIVSLIFDYVAQVRIDNKSNSLNQNQFAALFMNKIFRIQFLKTLNDLNQDNGDDLAIDCMYVIRKHMEMIPNDVVQFWLSCNQSQYDFIKSTWSEFISDKVE